VTDVWRIVVDESPVDGAWNMALDRALQLSREAGQSPPTLRLYRWLRPTITLGRFQKLTDVDVAFCASRGIDVVRRFTGGRGVLHDDEVTYAIVAGIGDGIPRGVAASYRLLCSGLAEAYRLLGVPAALTTREQGVKGSAACYLHATAADLSLGARKLSGSAQVWSGSTVLQHGSFTITRDVDREAQAFRLSNSARDDLGSRTATLESALGHAPSVSQVVAAVREGVSTALGVRLQSGSVTAAEEELALTLLPQVSCEVDPNRAGPTP